LQKRLKIRVKEKKRIKRGNQGQGSGGQEATCKKHRRTKARLASLEKTNNRKNEERTKKRENRGIKRGWYEIGGQWLGGAKARGD